MTEEVKTPKRRTKTPAKKLDKDLQKAAEQFDKFDSEIKSMTMDRLNTAPKEEVEPQTKLSSTEIGKSKDIYLKPERTLPPGTDPKSGRVEQFNDKFREQYNYDKEYVQFIAENKEILGETIEMWTKPYPGMNCEFWKVPTNKPVWGPRYLAEQIKRKNYHRLMMQDKPTNMEGGMTYYGQMTVDTTIQRLDAMPVSKRKSIFMGSNSF